MLLPGKTRVTDRDAALLLFVFLMSAAGVGLFSLVQDSPKAAAASVALALALVVGCVAFAMRRNKHSLSCETDEGGVRMVSRDHVHHYVPFSHLKSAGLLRFMGQGQLRLDGANGEVRTLTIGEAHAPDLDAQINLGIVEQNSARSLTPSNLSSMLAKNDQPLDKWLGRVRDMARADYRERHLDAEELIAVALDKRADVEVRAAAAHALVWQRDHEKATLVMESLGRFTPPLVTVAATLATMQGTYVAGYEDASRFLSKDDRAVARRMIDERPTNLRIAARQPEAEPEASVHEQEEPLNRGVNRA